MVPTRKTSKTSRRATGSSPSPTRRAPQPKMHSASRPVQEQRVLGASSAVTGDAASASASALESMCGRVSRDSERSVGVPNGGDEEGLGLLRQQLSAVKRIRMEHERKDAAIAALRLEVSKLSRDKEEAVNLKHEYDGMRVRLAGLGERCRQLENAERESAHQWARKEDAWRLQIRDADERLEAVKERYRAEKNRAEELASAVKEKLEPALAAAEAEAKAAMDAAAREQAGHAEVELRAVNAAKSLNVELEAERGKVRDFEEKMRGLEKELAVSRKEVERLAPRVENLEKTNEALRQRCSKVELELAQVHVYRPLVERADSIDRRRTEAEEGLRAAEAELQRERASFETVRRNAAELKAELDRHRERLAKAESEASKTLSLERDLLFLNCRLEGAETAKENASRAWRNSEDSRRALAAALEELADLATEALPRPTPSLKTTEHIVPGGSVGEDSVPRGVELEDLRGKNLAGKSSAAADIVKRLAVLEASLRRCTWQGEAAGVGELRRAVRAVRALAESAAIAFADRDRQVKEITHAKADVKSLRERMEALRLEGKLAAKALEDALAARSALVPQLQDAQVSRIAAEAAVRKARSELAAVRDFLGSISETFSRSGTQGEADDVRMNDVLPWSDPPRSKSEDLRSPRMEPGAAAKATEARATRWPSNARLVSVVSAGVKGLLASQSTAADTIRDLESRCSRAGKEIEELRGLAKDRDAAHRDELTILRNRCESEVDAQRQAKNAAKSAAESALENLAASLKKMSAFDKEKTRISKHVTEMNGRLTALSAEASAANRGLHLLARACAPLIERCRLLATQKRLLTKMLHERPLTPVELEPVAAPLTDGLRALVAALDDSTEGTTSTRRRGDKRGGEKGEGGVREILSRAPRPLVSLRAVGIAMVAAQRFVRLAAFRASRRIVSTRREEADVPALHAAKVNMGFGGCCGGVDGTRGSGMVYSHGAKSLNDRCKYREDVIPLGPRGAGGVFMLEEAEVSPTLSPAAAAILDPGNTSVGSAAWACLGILDALICDQVKDGAWVRGFGGEVMGDGEPSLLRVLAAGQARHWRRLQERGLVPVRLVLWEADGREARIGGSLGTARVVVGRLARHHGKEWMAWRRHTAEREALGLMDATRRRTASLARGAEESERRYVESEARRLRAEAELGSSLEGAKALRAEIDNKSESVAILEKRMRILEREASGTVDAAAFASVEEALAESQAEVERLRARSASLEAEVAEASERREKAARQARRGAEAALKEQVVRAQLQEELLSLRSYVLRSEQTVQELQEETRRQARESGRRGDPCAHGIVLSGSS